MREISTKVLVGAVALLAVALLNGPASAQYEGPGTLTCTPTTVSVGQSITCTATGYEPGATVTFTIGGLTLGTAVADDAGVATITAAVPTGVSLGAVAVVTTGTAFDGTETLRLETTVTVVTLATTVAPPLPTTGSDSKNLAQIALVLLGVGGVLILAARRRKAGSASERVTA